MREAGSENNVFSDIYLSIFFFFFATFNILFTGDFQLDIFFLFYFGGITERQSGKVIFLVIVIYLLFFPSL